MRRLRGQRLEGTYWMRAEHLWEWLREHQTKEESEESEEKGVVSEPEGRGIGTKGRREEGGE